MAGIASSLLDTVSGLFLEALGTDMTAMEEYFPFVARAFSVIQIMAWAVLFLITVWQLFRVFGGPITEAENPWQLLLRSALFAVLIGYAKPIFLLALEIARAPYTSLMDLTMTAEHFTFAGLEQVLTNGLISLLSALTIVGLTTAPTLRNQMRLTQRYWRQTVSIGMPCSSRQRLLPLCRGKGPPRTTVLPSRRSCRDTGSRFPV